MRKGAPNDVYRFPLPLILNMLTCIQLWKGRGMGLKRSRVRPGCCCWSKSRGRRRSRCAPGRRVGRFRMWSCTHLQLNWERPLLWKPSCWAGLKKMKQLAWKQGKKVCKTTAVNAGKTYDQSRHFLRVILQSLDWARQARLNGYPLNIDPLLDSYFIAYYFHTANDFG